MQAELIKNLESFFNRKVSSELHSSMKPQAVPVGIFAKVATALLFDEIDVYQWGYLISLFVMEDYYLMVNKKQ